MDNTSHPNEKQLEAMLKLTAQRMGTTPQALKEAAQRGDLSQLMGRSGSQQAAALQKVLSDPEAAKKLLSTPQPKNCCSFWAARAEQSPDITPVPGERGPFPWRT